MDCEAISEKLSCYLDGELSPEDCQLVQRHLDDCRGCSDELAAMRRLVTATAAFADVEPPQYLRRRIALSTVASPPSVYRHIILRLYAVYTPATLRWSVAGAVAAVAIVVAAFVSTHEPVVSPSTTSEPVLSHAEREPTKPQAIEPTVIVEASPKTPAVHPQPRQISSHRPVSSPSASSKQERSATVIAAAPRPSAARANIPVRAIKSSSPQETATDQSNHQEAKNDVAANVGLWNTREEGISGSVRKSSMADVVAGELSSTAVDDAAMARSLKQQLRMQKQGDGISVDVIDVRF